MSWLLRSLLWTLLGGWLGSWTLFALVIAPTAFSVLPSPEAAGSLVSPVLATLHDYGIGAGLACGLIAALLRRGKLLLGLPLVLTLLCIVSEYGVTPAIHAVESSSLDQSSEPERDRFSRLHETSRAIFGAVQLGVLLLIVLHARVEGTPALRPGGGPVPERSLRGG